MTIALILKTEERNSLLPDTNLIRYLRHKRVGLLCGLALFIFSGCASSERPLADMIYASAAMKAAARARAERRAPDLFRRAELSFWTAKKFYLIKSYSRAKVAARRAKILAEKAEEKAKIKEVLDNSDAF